MARASHFDFRARRWSRRTTCRPSSVSGILAPPGSGCPATSRCSSADASARSSSARPPQCVCCTVSQAPLTLRTRLSFIAATSCPSSAAREVQSRGCPPTTFGLAAQASASTARSPAAAMPKLSAGSPTHSRWRNSRSSAPLTSRARAACPCGWSRPSPAATGRRALSRSSPALCPPAGREWSLSTHSSLGLLASPPRSSMFTSSLASGASASNASSASSPRVHTTSTEDSSAHSVASCASTSAPRVPNGSQASSARTSP
mmetsp:Transcript_100865/g.274268  ORF Transcript_100865/g.274268 Transcript_100865/m.274268 type:complete len:260 (-) Transcript_100865:795-1574(-)